MKKTVALILCLCMVCLCGLFSACAENADVQLIKKEEYSVEVPGDWIVKDFSAVSPSKAESFTLIQLSDVLAAINSQDERTLLQAVADEMYEDGIDFQSSFDTIEGRLVSFFSYKKDGILFMFSNIYDGEKCILLAHQGAGTKDREEVKAKLIDRLLTMKKGDTLVFSADAQSVSVDAQAGNVTDITVMKTDDLIDQINLMEQELISRQIAESGRILVYDEKGIKIYFDGFGKSAYDDKINFIIMNNSDNELPLVVSIDELYIDNWDVLYNGYVATVLQNKNELGKGRMDWDKCITATKETASKIDVKFSFSVDEGKYDRKDLYDTDLITFYINTTYEPVAEGVTKIGISMPTKDRYRWNQDGTNLEKQLREAGYDVDLRYASNDVLTQLDQINGMIDNGCKVIVVASIEGSSLCEALDKAAAKGVKVIAYDRLLTDDENVDYYVTFDNYKAGVVQGMYVMDVLRLDENEGPFYVEFSGGDLGDENAAYYFNGAMDILSPYIESGKVVVKSGQTKFEDVCSSSYKSAVAQERAENILAQYYEPGSRIDAWICPNDSVALGVINALEANYKGDWPIVTGGECDKENVKLILAGKQSMSVFKDSRFMVDQTVELVDQILKGNPVITDKYTDNWKKDVPTILCVPVFCSVDNYKYLLIDTGYYTMEDLQ